MSKHKPHDSTHVKPDASYGQVLRGRLSSLESCIAEVAYPGRGGARKRRVESVHGLRVATRKAAAILDVVTPLLDPMQTIKASKRLKRLRSAGGLVRDCDVQRKLLRELAAECPAAEQTLIERIVEEIDAQRAKAWKVLARTARRYEQDSIRKRHKRLMLPLMDAELPAGDAIGLASSSLDHLRHLVETAAAQDLNVIDRVHELRIACKRLRYGVEALSPWLRAGERGLSSCLSHLTDVQAELGRFNDSHQMLCRVESYAARVVQRLEAGSETGEPIDEARMAELVTLQSLVSRLRLRMEQTQETAVQTWRSAVERGLMASLRTLTPTPTTTQTPAATSAVPSDSAYVDSAAPGASPVVVVLPDRPPSAPSSNLSTSRERSSSRGPRIAAIDIGSNSTRLIIAEITSGIGGPADAEVSYRVLDDEREVTRLGKGLDATGLLDAESMRHAAAAIKRMKGISDGYGTERIRVVATAAVREARNGHVFVELVKQETGLTIEVISADEEAMLSYRSASRAFDLGAFPAIVVDVGGGSTEIVLSVPAAMRSATTAVGIDGALDAQNANSPQYEVRAHPDTDRASGEIRGGVIEHVYKVPLGAIRLTERFGGPEVCAKARFDEMRRAIKRQFATIIGQPPVVPLVLIGTGGTFNSLAAMCAAGELGPAASGLFAGTVQGYEVKRPQVMHLLDLLRKTPLKERTKVPGMSSDRADIIVAGLALVDRLMKYFGVNVIRVHEGGVRDGVLLGMAKDLQAARSSGKPARRDPLRSVRRFARACGYEQLHSKHVARLCLRVFDQLGDSLRGREKQRLAAGTDAEPSNELSPPASKKARYFTPENRLLLEAAALLHDVGYLINYSAHHKHSYHLIMHADLPGFTRREVQIIANVGRYHRLSEPKLDHRNFSLLEKADRKIVRVLAGILRVCDGLDRTHTQCVEGIDLTVDRKRSRVVLWARSAAEPSVDIWGAQRKSGLFAKALKLEPLLKWRSTKASAGTAAATSRSVMPSETASRTGVRSESGAVEIGRAR